MAAKRSWSWAWCAAAIVVAVVVLRAPSHAHQLFDPDEAAIATQAMAVEQGGTLYVDAIDRKPPLAPFVYAGVFRLAGSRDLRPVHVMSSVLLAAAALLAAAETRRLHGTAAALTTGLLFVAGATAFSPRDAQAANFSHLALLPGTAAIVWSRRDSSRAAVGGGVALGLATLTRQTWAIGVVPAAFASWRAGGRSTARAGFNVLAATATVLAVGIIVPLSGFFRWTFSGNGSLLTGVDDLPGRVSSGAGSLVTFVGGHVALVVLCVAEARLTRKEGQWRRDADLWLWLACGGVAVVVGFRFFGHYWMQALPPAALLAGAAVGHLRPVTVRRLAVVTGVTALLCFALAWFPQRVNPQPDPGPLVAEIRARTMPSDRVAVWGNFPELYWLSGRLPAGGFVSTDFLVGKLAGQVSGPESLDRATPGALDDYLAALRADPPPLILDTSTAGLRGWGDYPMSTLPELNDFVRAHYREVSRVDGVSVLVPVDPAPGGTRPQGP